MPLSMRQLLLQHLIENKDGTRRCTLGCPFHRNTFSANSDSAVWKKHFSSFHPAKLHELEAQCSGKRAAEEVDETTSVVASVASASLSVSSGSAWKKQALQPSVAASFGKT